MTSQRKVAVIVPSEVDNEYIQKCNKDIIRRGELPCYADETNVHATVVYIDHGITKQMQEQLENARRHYKIVEYRKINT